MDLIDIIMANNRQSVSSGGDGIPNIMLTTPLKLGENVALSEAEYDILCEAHRKTVPVSITFVIEGLGDALTTVFARTNSGYSTTYMLPHSDTAEVIGVTLIRDNPVLHAYNANVTYTALGATG